MKFIKFLLLFNFTLTYNFEFSFSDKFQNIEFNRNNVYSDLYSNAIYEMTNDNFESQDTIWLRTGAGLSFITFSNSLFFTVDSIFRVISNVLVSTNSDLNDLICSLSAAISYTFLSTEWDDEIITIDKTKKRKI